MFCQGYTKEYSGRIKERTIVGNKFNMYSVQPVAWKEAADTKHKHMPVKCYSLCWHQSSGGSAFEMSFGWFRFLTQNLRVKEQPLGAVAIFEPIESLFVKCENETWKLHQKAVKMSLASRLLAHRLVVAFERASRRLGKPSLLVSRWDIS